MSASTARSSSPTSPTASTPTPTCPPARTGSRCCPPGTTSDPILGPLTVTLQPRTVTMVYAVGNPSNGSMDAITHTLPLRADGSVEPRSMDTGSAGLAGDVPVVPFGDGRRAVEWFGRARPEPRGPPPPLVHLRARRAAARRSGVAVATGHEGRTRGVALRGRSRDARRHEQASRALADRSSTSRSAQVHCCSSGGRRPCTPGRAVQAQPQRQVPRRATRTSSRRNRPRRTGAVRARAAALRPPARRGGGAHPRGVHEERRAPRRAPRHPHGRLVARRLASG